MNLLRLVAVGFICTALTTVPASAQTKTVVKVEEDPSMPPGQGRVVFYDIEGYYYDINSAVLRSVSDTTYPLLTQPFFSKLNTAATQIAKLWQADTSVALHEWARLVIGVVPVERPARWKWFLGDDPGYQNIPADSVTAAIERVPQLKKAITDAGLTVAQYVRGISSFVKAWLMCGREDALAAEGRTLAIDSTTVLPKNMAFFRELAKADTGRVVISFLTKVNQKPSFTGTVITLSDNLFPDD